MMPTVDRARMPVALRAQAMKVRGGLIVGIEGDAQRALNDGLVALAHLVEQADRRWEPGAHEVRFHAREVLGALSVIELSVASGMPVGAQIIDEFVKAVLEQIAAAATCLGGDGQTSGQARFEA